MVYQEKLAEIYDLIYQDKDYEKECDFLEEIFRNYSPRPIKTILDAGCGTGGHAFPLTKRGYKVTGIDMSDAMIAAAGRKAKETGLNINLQQMDLRHLNLGETFDACLCMFAVLGYITETSDILKTLESVKRHLNKNSLFIFDVWNGLAVLRILPETRVKTVAGREKRIIRIAQPELDASNHICRVHYSLFVTRDETLLEEIKETHTVRYFFPLEIIHYLSDTGFEVLKVCPFLDLAGKVDENVWNMAVIARAT